MREDIAKLWRREEACEQARTLSGEVYREVAGRRTLRVVLGERQHTNPLPRVILACA